MFSKACEYGIRAMIYLTAASKEGSKMSIRDICRETGAPEHFTAKILRDLSRKGLVSSLKGPKGGFFMEDEQGKDRKSVVSGKSVSVRVDLGGSRVIQKTNETTRRNNRFRTRQCVM